MKKITKKTLSFAMAMAMASTVVPSNVMDTTKAFATELTTATQNPILDGSKVLPEKKAQKRLYVEGQAIVMYRNSSANVKKASNGTLFGEDIQIEKSCKFTPKKSISVMGMTLKKGYTVSLVSSEKYTAKELVNKLRTQDNVMYAQPNYMRYAQDTDNYNDRLWGIENTGQLAGVAGTDTGVSKIDKSKVNKDEKVVAIIDTGVDYSNAEFKDAIWNNPYQSQLKGEHGFDFINWDADPMDDNDHGTHCAGIIAAANDNQGVTGVAADCGVKIMPLKFLGKDGSGDTYGAISAYGYIYEAQQLGVNVVAVNNSWGGTIDYEYGDDVLEEVINAVGENGAVSVCAASNDGTNNDDAENVSPCCLKSDYIISVAAANSKGELATFSNYGKKTVDVAAPGADILSTVVNDTFAPSLYKDKEAMCSNYFDFNGSLEQVDVEQMGTSAVSENGKYVYALENEGEGTATVTLDEKEGFGGAGDKALHFSIKNAKEGDSYTMYLLYNKKASTTPLYQNLTCKMIGPEFSIERYMTDDDYWPSTVGISDIKLKSDGEIEDGVSIGGLYVTGDMNYWSQNPYKEMNKVSEKKAGRYAYTLSFSVSDDGDYDFIMDDFAETKSGVKKEQFGKYAYFNGTSMAAPYVTGCVAISKGMYPKDSSLETRNRVVTTARKVDALKDKVAAGGMVDVSNFANPSPAISSVKIGTGAAITVEGVFFGEDPKVTVNGQPVVLIEKSTNSVTFAGAYNKALQVEITGSNGRVEQNVFFADGEDTKISYLTELSEQSGDVISDGDNLIMVDSLGNFRKFAMTQNPALTGMGTSYIYEKDPEVATSKMIPFIDYVASGNAYDLEELFGKSKKYAAKSTIENIAAPICIGKEVYSLISVDTGYVQETALVYYDEEKETWVNTNSKLPNFYFNVIGAKMVEDQENIYLIGGYNKETQKSLKTVYKYNIASNTWSEIVSLPEGKFNMQAEAVDGKIIVALGGTGDDKTVGSEKTFIYDGQNWTEGASLTGIQDTETEDIDVSYSDSLVENNELKVDKTAKTAVRTLNYYYAATGYTDEGMIFAGLNAEGLGNTFTYQLAGNSFVSLNKKFVSLGQTDKVMGVTVGDKFVVMSGQECETYDFDSWFLFSKEASSNKQYETEQKTGYLDLPEKGIFGFTTFDVKNEMVEVTMKSNVEGGILRGAGKYHVGDTAKLAVIPSSDYFVKSLTVGKVKAVSTAAITLTGDVEAKVEFGKYVSYLYNMNPATTFEAELGEKLALAKDVTMEPEDADDKTLLWTSSNDELAKVDDEGNVTFTKDQTKIGKKVTITATAADREMVSLTWTYVITKVQVATKVVVKSAKTSVKPGKTLLLNATVKPATVKNQSVTWKVSNKKYATISKLGVLKAKKAGQGKTVVVTATSVNNPKISGKIKIKIAKVAKKKTTKSKK